MDDLHVTPALTIPARNLSFAAVRASGPGGQNVNKVASKVELRFDLPGCDGLGAAQKARLRALAGARLDADGFLLLVDQSTRDQSRNLEAARQRLAQLIRQALVVPKKRRPTRPSKAAKQRRLDSKRKLSDKKRERRRADRE